MHKEKRKVMTAETRTREEVLAELEAERARQADQRVLVAEAAWNMRQNHEDPCLSGVNEFLGRHRIPVIPDSDENLNSARLRDEALRLVTYGFDPEEFTAAGLARRLPGFREQGGQWLEGFITAVQQAARDNDVPRDDVAALVRRLRGEPEPAPQAVTENAAVQSQQAPRLPRPQSGYTDVAMQVTFAIRVPSRNTSGASDAMIQGRAQDTIRQAIRNAVARSEYAAAIADSGDGGLQITSAVQRG
jgi:hypothetical protein